MTGKMSCKRAKQSPATGLRLVCYIYTMLGSKEHVSGQVDDTWFTFGAFLVSVRRGEYI